jgi:hypothetical protein
MENNIVLIIAVDIIGVLASSTLSGNIYFFDNNKMAGSTGEGSDCLKTKILFRPNEETTLVWNVMPLEPESFAGISKITADNDYLDIKRGQYPDSDVVYWTGKVKKQFERLSYKLTLAIGTNNAEYSCELEIIGKSIH